MSQDPDAAPINSLPVAVILIALPMVAAELVFLLGSEGLAGGSDAVGWRIAAVERFAVFVPLFDYMVQTGQWDLNGVLRFVAYPFLHWGFLHMVMVLVFLLALGKMVGEVFGSGAVAAIFFGSAIAGALAYAVLTTDRVPLIGGYPGVYGLIGAYTFLLWSFARAAGGPQHRAFGLIAVLLSLQLVFGLIYGSGFDWVAEVAGFAAGFLISFVASPGGRARLLARLRRR